MIENQLVKLEDLAKAYETLLGAEFAVHVDSMVNVDENKIPIIMYATRMPYKIPNIDTETLQMGFSAYISCENKEAYAEKITRISRLLGYNKGTLSSNGNTYTYYSFLDFSRPLTDPVVDSGEFMQSLVLSGTCLISGAQGALVGNDVITELVFNPTNIETRLEGQVEVLTASCALVKDTESPQMANAVIGKSFNKTQLYSYSYQLLVLKNAIGERLLKGARNILPFGINERIDLKETFPAFTGESFNTTNQCVFTGIQLDRNAGAFTTATITLQDKLEL
ncbi:MAG: hypothetical protein PHV79_00205 [Clostridia bacterium]|jgi:hypothetical protein|nr:hypothetical protein [Clostridia bacterium]